MIETNKDIISDVTDSTQTKDYALPLLTGLVYLDYVLTWIGINKIGIIEEFNPLMAWLFEIGFIPGSIIRILIIAFLLICFKLLKPYKYYYKLTTRFAIAVNIIVQVLHIRWIIYAIRIFKLV